MQPKIKFPYGISNLEQLITEGYQLVDKTLFLAPLEENEKFVSFLRPRRIGKSLFVSMLEYYYDINKKNLFNTLFSNTYIGKNPTPLANTFRVLKMDFSGIDTQDDKSSYKGFLHKIATQLSAFMESYSLFEEKDRNAILSNTTPAEMVRTFFGHYREERPRIYLIIDEYDHFTNEILLRNLEEFKTTVSQDGYVRKFYETLKEATQQGIIDRFFITGVSPVTLDSLTSGFNIVTHLTYSPIFHNLMGFTEEETRNLLLLVLEDKNRLETIMNDLRGWYNGYRFEVDTKDTVYNSDMVLFFLQRFKLNNTYPKLMLDPNIMPDYGKLQKIFEVANFVGNIEVLEEILGVGEVEWGIFPRFSEIRPLSKESFLAALYHQGLIALKGNSEIGGYVFCIPNQAARDVCLSLTRQASR